MPLKGLEDHNAERIRAHTSTTGRKCRPNGIACPKCGGELVDDDATPGGALIRLASYPPRVPVRCPACGLNSSRVE